MFRAGRWCDAGLNLIVVTGVFRAASLDHPEVHSDGEPTRCSIYLGSDLLDTFVLPHTYHLVAASAGASVLHFATDPQSNPDGLSSVRTVTRNGTILAEHLILTAWLECDRLTSGWQDGSLLAVASAGDNLYVCSAGGLLQVVSLGRPASKLHQNHVQVSSCNELAAVCIIGPQIEVLFVNLAQQCVVHRHILPAACFDEEEEFDPDESEEPDIGYRRIVLAQSGHKVAFCGHDGSKQTSLLVTTSGDARTFVLPRPSTHLGTRSAGFLQWEWHRLAWLCTMLPASAWCHGSQQSTRLQQIILCDGIQGATSWCVKGRDIVIDARL